MHPACEVYSKCDEHLHVGERAGQGRRETEDESLDVLAHHGFRDPQVAVDLREYHGFEQFQCHEDM
jgi:hypothetical protein